MTTHTLTPSPFSRSEVLVSVTGPEAERGHALALAVGGRWASRLGGHLMTPRRAARWRVLFDAGWTAEKRYLDAGYMPYRFTLGSHKLVTLATAVIISRNLKPQALEV